MRLVEAGVPADGLFRIGRGRGKLAQFEFHQGEVAEQQAVVGHLFRQGLRQHLPGLRQAILLLIEHAQVKQGKTVLRLQDQRLPKILLRGSVLPLLCIDLAQVHVGPGELRGFTDRIGPQRQLALPDGVALPGKKRKQDQHRDSASPDQARLARPSR